MESKFILKTGVKILTLSTTLIVAGHIIAGAAIGGAGLVTVAISLFDHLQRYRS